eukprot:1684358-Pleurochrysis_carterae.AAC.2
MIPSEEKARLRLRSRRCHFFSRFWGGCSFVSGCVSAWAATTAAMKMTVNAVQTVNVIHAMMHSRHWPRVVSKYPPPIHSCEKAETA